MTIVQALNEIAVAQGGTASKGGSIAEAIDALNDALAGSDQDAASTIEGAIRLLGQHIGSGGGEATTEVYLWNLTEDETLIQVAPAGVKYLSGYSGGDQVWTVAQAEAITGELSGIPVKGVKATVPTGAVLDVTFDGSYTTSSAITFYSDSTLDFNVGNVSGMVGLAPIEGKNCVGIITIEPTA